MPTRGKSRWSIRKLQINIFNPCITTIITSNPTTPVLKRETRVCKMLNDRLGLVLRVQGKIWDGSKKRTGGQLCELGSL